MFANVPSSENVVSFLSRNFQNVFFMHIYLLFLVIQTLKEYSLYKFANFIGLLLFNVL